MRFRLQVEYDGSTYSGWQLQNGQITVQGEIENALKTILGNKIRITGAGRTDSGVHARGQVAHFDSDIDVEAGKTLRSLNGLLNKDIRIKGLEPAHKDFHARYDAKKRTYLYYISQKPVALIRNYCWHVYWELDIALMNKACKQIIGRHDFKSFCRELSEVKNHFCEVEIAEWYFKDGLIVFSIQANRFLHGMVRSLVGTIVDIGRSRLNVNDMGKILETRDRSSAGQSAPAKGLVLEKVFY